MPREAGPAVDAAARQPRPPSKPIAAHNDAVATDAAVAVMPIRRAGVRDRGIARHKYPRRERGRRCGHTERQREHRGGQPRRADQRVHAARSMTPTSAQATRCSCRRRRSARIGCTSQNPGQDLISTPPMIANPRSTSRGVPVGVTPNPGRALSRRRRQQFGADRCRRSCRRRRP